MVDCCWGGGGGRGAIGEVAANICTDFPLGLTSASEINLFWDKGIHTREEARLKRGAS
jgi:hypothetical protein